MLLTFPTTTRRKVRRGLDWGDTLDADRYLAREPNAWERSMRDPVTRRPKAQALLKPVLAELGPDDFVFSPRRAEAERRERLHAARRTPLSCGNVPGSNRREKPAHEPGECYTNGSYWKAIARACRKAFPLLDELKPDTVAMKSATRRGWIAERGEAGRKHHEAVLAWHHAYCWAPNQLRHTAATKVRNAFRLDAAQMVLGHAKADTTQIYAQANFDRAAEVMAAMG